MLDRIKYIMNLYDISAAQFAEAIGVPRSTISHILSGRNKPSLDFVMKILDAYPKVNPEWLLTGKQKELTSNDNASRDLNQIQNNITTKESEASVNTSKKIKRVVVFFEDGTYTEVAS